MLVEHIDSIQKFFPNGVRWDEKNDNPQIKSYIARIALLITTLSANIVKEVKSEPGVPQKPDPKRMMMICYSISCGHGFLNGRTSLTMDDLLVPIRLLDTIPESRYDLLQALVKNGGTITSKQYAKISGFSRGSIYTRFNEFVTLGVCKYVSTPDVTKPILTITLHQDFHWLLDDVIIATMP